MARFLSRISSTLPFVRISEHTGEETAVLPDEVVSTGENDLASTTPSEGPENPITSPESAAAMPSACSAPASQTSITAGSLPSSCVVVEEDPSCQRRQRRAHRHRSSSRRHHRACRIKWKDVNFMALMSSVIAAILVCTSIAESHWWYVSGGWCRDLQHPVTYLGVRTFFFDGHFENVMQDGRPSSVYYYGATTSDSVLIDCLSHKTVNLIQVIVAFCFLVIVFNISAVLVEMITFTNCFMKLLRRTAIFSILSVCVCVTINGLSYLVTQQLSEYYEANPFRMDSKIDVEFSLSFYTIMASGVMSIFAVAFTLLCRRNSHSSGATASRWSPSVTTGRLGGRRCHDERLIDADFNQLDRSSNCESLPPFPPPYSP